MLKEQIECFVPFNEQEQIDKEYFLNFINTFEDVLTRKNEFGHFTASAFVVNKAHNRMLVVYHNILRGWIYPGGHVDGETDFLNVAIREVEEETNQNVKILQNEIYAIEANPTNYHIKNGKGIPSHIHYDVIYLMEGDETKPLKYREEESSGVKWLPFEEAMNEEIVYFARPIHEKLIRKLRK